MASTTTRNGEKEVPKGNEQDNDLKALLSPDQREEFTLLIANITEEMRKQISDTFDAAFTAEKKTTEDLGLQGRNPNVDHSRNQTEEIQKAQQLQQKREKEISAPKLQQLKKNALAYFEKWQRSVLVRVGEVLSTKETADNQRDQAKRRISKAHGPPARPQYKVVGMSDIFKIKGSCLTPFVSHTYIYLMFNV